MAGQVSFQCGGVLIHRRYVITAAHCIRDKNLLTNWILTSVRLGEYNTTSNPDCLDYPKKKICNDKLVNIPIESQTVHEDYDPWSRHKHNDIALLRLAEDAPRSRFIQPACLPHNGDLAKRFQVAGWGLTENNTQPEVKLKVDLPLVKKNLCHQRYRKMGVDLIDSQICAGGERGKDSCRGDSGGPLMQFEPSDSGDDKLITVAGLVSFGPTCGITRLPGVYTKVYDYIPWILSKMRYDKLTRNNRNK